MYVYFWTVLQVLATSSAQRTYQCNQNNEYGNYISCLNTWRIIRESSRGHSIFLKDVSLIDEICILPGTPNVKEMDTCVTNAISLFCESIFAHWKAVKQFVNYLCKHRDAFEGTYARCRKNLDFQSAYENCMATHVKELNAGNDNCRSYRKLQKCIKDSLSYTCSKSATEFFSIAFEAREGPLIAYSCKQADEHNTDYAIDVHSGSVTKSKRMESSDKMSIDTDQHAGSHKTETLEDNNLEVDATNMSTRNSAFSNVLTFIVLLLRIL